MEVEAYYKEFKLANDCYNIGLKLSQNPKSLYFNFPEIYKQSRTNITLLGRLIDIVDSEFFYLILEYYKNNRHENALRNGFISNYGFNCIDRNIKQQWINIDVGGIDNVYLFVFEEIQ